MKICTLPIVQILFSFYWDYVVVGKQVIFTNEPCRGRRLQRSENNQFRYKFCGPAGHFWIYDCEPAGTVFSSFYQKCLPVLVSNLKHVDDGYKKIDDGNISTVIQFNTTTATLTTKSSRKIATVRLLKLYTIGHAKQPVYKAPPPSVATPTTVNTNKVTVSTTKTPRKLAQNLDAVYISLSSLTKQMTVKVIATTTAKSPIDELLTRTPALLPITSTTAAKSPVNEMVTQNPASYHVRATTAAKSPANEFVTRTLLSRIATITAKSVTSQVVTALLPVTATAAAPVNKLVTRTPALLPVAGTTTAKSPLNKLVTRTFALPAITATTAAKSSINKLDTRTSTSLAVITTTTAKSTVTKYKAKEPIVFVPRDLTAILDMMGHGSGDDHGRQNGGHLILEEPEWNNQPKIYSSNRRLVAVEQQSMSKNRQIEAEKRFLERLRILERRTLG